jgi:hypothetical protein
VPRARAALAARRCTIGESGEEIRAPRSERAGDRTWRRLGDHVVVLHTGSGTGHPHRSSGLDGDGDTRPGRRHGQRRVPGSPERDRCAPCLRIITPRAPLHVRLDRASVTTATSIPDRPEAGLELAAPDTWPPGARCVPAATRDVDRRRGDARARRAVRAHGRHVRPIAVVYGGTSQVQSVRSGPRDRGAHARASSESGLYPTGMGAMDAVVVGPRVSSSSNAPRRERSRRSISTRPGERLATEIIGDVSAGPFPATDAELGRRSTR